MFVVEPLLTSDRVCAVTSELGVPATVPTFADLKLPNVTAEDVVVVAPRELDAADACCVCGGGLDPDDSTTTASATTTTTVTSFEVPKDLHHPQFRKNGTLRVYGIGTPAISLQEMQQHWSTTIQTFIFLPRFDDFRKLVENVCCAFQTNLGSLHFHDRKCITIATPLYFSSL